MKFIKRYFAIFIFILVCLLYFYPTIVKGLLPIPSDTIIGLYHPFRDFYAKEYPRGIPFKNFLITDPVRQIIPWKELTMERLERLQLPLWNPYEMAGKPLLANFQSSPFYPLNIILLIKPFYFSWTIFIFAQILLSGTFIYLYLRNLNLHKYASLLGSLAYSFSGFSVAWFEWGNIIHTVLWLPLILLSIDKIFYYWNKNLVNKRLIWILIFAFSIISSFFAGHLQTFFYIFIFTFVYFFTRWIQNGKKREILFVFFIFIGLFLILTSVQWIPTLQFINLSARNIDQLEWTKVGWFVPWENLAQFIAPDFFGNPTTLNYWGVWNYGEFVGYIGLLPFLFACFAVITRRDKKTFFFTTALITAFLFAFPTFFGKLPYVLKIPFISTSQPTRLVAIICFSLAVLSALGLDFYLKNEKIVKVKAIFVFLLSSLFLIWLFIVVFFGNKLFAIFPDFLVLAKRNLIFTTLLLLCSLILFFLSLVYESTRFKKVILITVFVLVAFDLLRFANKFEPFTKKEYLFPITSSLNFIKNDNSVFRVASNDLRILPPNFATHYKIQSIEGYDPLYLLRYAEFVAAMERNKPNISAPFGFNRIITPHNINSPLFDLLNVKYVLSFNDISSPRFKRVFGEGKTQIFENKMVYPRAFFVKNIINANSKEESIEQVFASNLKETAVVEGFINKTNLSIGKAEILDYQEEKIVIKTNNPFDGFLVVSDVYYPNWKAVLDKKDTKIYRTDYAFRGVYVPKGNHIIEMYINLF